MNLYKGQINRGGGGIASHGDLVAHTEGTAFDIKLYNASDRTNPTLLSTIPGLGFNDSFGARIELGSDRLVASNPYLDEVLIVDTTNPSNPTIGATLSLDPRQILIHGHTLFVRTTSTIEVYDISDAGNPTQLTTLMGTSSYSGVAVANDMLVVSDYSAGLRLLDISDPSNITELSLYPVINSGRLTVQGDIVALMDGTLSTIFIDISDPDNPVEITSTGVPPMSSLGFRFVGDYLLYPSNTGVSVYNVSSIATPQYEGVISGPEVLDTQVITSLGDDLAMVSGSYFSIRDLQTAAFMNSQIYNDNPLSPGASLNGIHPDGDYAYSYDSSSNSLVVIDISDPQNPTQAASYSLGETIYSIDYEDDIVYLGTSGALVQAIDVANPLSPTPINSWNVSSTASKVQISGDYLYAMVGNNGFEVYDVSSLQSPMLVSSASGSLSNENTDMHVSGDRLVTIQYSEGGGFSGNYMYIYDVSDPANPVALDYGPNDFGPLLPDYYAGGLQLDGHTLYITLGGYYHNGPSIYNGKFASYDISDDVELLDTLTFENIDSDFEDGAKLGHIMLDGDSAYVAPRNIGGSLTNQSISLFNIADPQNLEYIGASGVAEFLPTGAAAMQNDKIYLAGGGLAIFDASTSCAGSCPADLTGDGVLDFFDVSMFLSAFNTQDPVADFTGDGIWDFFDVSAFLGAYNAGCP
ncbi:MAG: GC-type dockerin domain-anchored protein [Phycisphaerales bacterium]